MAGCNILPGMGGQILAPLSYRHGPFASFGIGTYRKLNREYLCFLVEFARAMDVATPGCAKKTGNAPTGGGGTRAKVGSTWRDIEILTCIFF